MRGLYCPQMVRRRLSAAAVLIAAFVAGAPARLGAQAATRAVYASALDERGAPAPDLHTSDFVVREDKIAREILDVGPALDPMEITLLVDNSQAAEAYVRDYRQALTAFIRAIGANEYGTRHQLSIVTLAERPTINTGYTSDTDLAIKGAQRVFALPGTGTYLLDGIMEVSRGISKRGAHRPVIVAIVTEGPDLSDQPWERVLEPLRASGAALHVIVVGHEVNQAYDRGMVLERGTRDTGGRRDNILSGSGLTRRMEQVAAELINQYKVTYSRPRTLIPPERVAVSTNTPGLTVRGTPARDVQERP